MYIFVLIKFIQAALVLEKAGKEMQLRWKKNFFIFFVLPTFPDFARTEEEETEGDGLHGPFAFSIFTKKGYTYECTRMCCIYLSGDAYIDIYKYVCVRIHKRA